MPPTPTSTSSFSSSTLPPSNAWTDRSRSASGIRTAGGSGANSRPQSNTGSGAATPTTAAGGSNSSTGLAQGVTSAAAAGRLNVEHVPVGGFNAGEVREWLRKSFTDALAGDSTRAAQYKASGSSGGTAATAGGKSGPWGSKPTVMANGQDYWVQLTKQVAAREEKGGG